MYQEFYNFSADPFRLSPDHNFAYAHKGYTKAWAYMEYAFMQAEGFVMITGRPGTGKTTLIGALLAKLANSAVSIANLVSTQLQSDDLLKLVAYDFGIPESVVEKGELLQRLTRQLKTWHREGRRALLIVDEAQDLSVSAMEELRLLTNIQVDSRPLLQIFLLGQPELRELILSPRLEQVHQRIIAASHLRPLEQDETESYIRHRLETVNWRGNPAISKSVYPLIYKFSEGVPRRINLICSRLLLHCAVEQRQQVAVADVREVVKELQEENLASGDSFVESDFLVADSFEEDQDAGVEGGNNHQQEAAQNGSAGSGTTEAVSNDRTQASHLQDTPPQAGRGQTVLPPRTPISTTANRAPQSALAGTGQNGKTPPTQLTGTAEQDSTGQKGGPEHADGHAQKNNPGWTRDQVSGRKRTPEQKHETENRQTTHTPDARASWPKILMACVTVILASFGNWS